MEKPLPLPQAEAEEEATNQSVVSAPFSVTSLEEEEGGGL